MKSFSWLFYRDKNIIEDERRELKDSKGELNEKLRSINIVKFMVAFSWLFIFMITLPPLLRLGVSYGLEPHGTCCTLDYWNHNGDLSFKYYFALLSLSCYIFPLGFNIVSTTLSKENIRTIRKKNERNTILCEKITRWKL